MPDLSQQPVLGIKEILRTGSCEPVGSHHCLRAIIKAAHIYHNLKATNLFVTPAAMSRFIISS